MAIKDLKNLTPEEWENLTQEDWKDIWMGIVQSSRDSIPTFRKAELSEEQKAKVQQLLKELKIDTGGEGQ